MFTARCSPGGPVRGSHSNLDVYHLVTPTERCEPQVWREGKLCFHLRHHNPRRSNAEISQPVLRTGRSSAEWRCADSKTHCNFVLSDRGANSQSIRSISPQIQSTFSFQDDMMSASASPPHASENESGLKAYSGHHPLVQFIMVLSGALYSSTKWVECLPRIMDNDWGTWQEVIWREMVHTHTVYQGVSSQLVYYVNKGLTVERTHKGINASKPMVQKKAQDLTSEGSADIPAHPLSSWLLGWMPLLVHPALWSRTWPLRTTSPGLPHCLSSGCVWPKGITGKRLGLKTRFLPLLTDTASSSSSAPDTYSPTSQTLHSLLSGIQKHWVLPLPWGPSFSVLLIPGSRSMPCLPLILSTPLQRVPS